MTIAVRKMTKAHLKIQQLRREAVESYIDQMIGLLDDLDGDENLEPYLADTFPASEDREGDVSDLEPSCGWTPSEAASGRYADVLGYEEEEFVNEDGYQEGV